LLSIIIILILGVEYTKRYIRVLILSLIFVLLSKASPVKAAVIFFDSFSGGYNTSLWTIAPGQFAPIPTLFGIAVDPQHADAYSTLIHTELLPNDVIIKVDMKINASPASDMGIFISDPATGSWKNIFLFGVGYGGIPNTSMIRDSSIWSNPSLYARGTWDYSVGIHHIEIHISSSANIPITIFEDGETKLTWTSNMNFELNQISFGIYGINSEFANYQLCDNTGCTTPTPSPTPTSTPTPTPSPTSSPTPTPTPIPVTKVVMIPGLGGSWNKDAILHCKANNYSGTWTSWPAADKVYSPIINALNASGFTAKPFYYDWRKQIPDTAPLLTNFINTNVVPNEKVDIVGHSMGGLVGRAYVEKEKGGNKADKLMTVGTPHQGTLLAYPAWSNGEIWGSFLWKIAATIATKSCKSIGLSDREIVQRFMPSAQNMLPTFDYLKDLKTGTTKPIANMNAQNNWLDPNLPPLFINTTVGTLSGFGVNTLQFMSVINPSRRDQTLGNWLDGRPVKREYTIQGDGAVLTVSTMLSGAINKQISQDHVGIIASTEGVDEILRFLSGAILSTSIPKTTAREPKSALVIIGDPANFWVVADGKTIKDTDGLVVITDPKTGLYTLRLLPKTTSTKIIVAQFLEGDRVLWKEYQWKSIFPKFGTIKFDASNPIEDALK